MKIVHRFITIPLLLLAATTATHGDGIPVAPDRKSVTVESFTIPLDEDQVKQVERLRIVTLSKEQLAPLVAIYDKVPPTIEVVSSRYDDCTCHLEVYGIWCRPGEIEVPKDRIAYKKYLDDYRAANPAQEEGTEHATAHEQYEFVGLTLDSAGTIYRDGKTVEESEVMALIDAMYERRKQNDRLDCSVVLDTPPPIDEATDARIRELAKRIKTHCDARVIGFWAAGIGNE